jgi:cytochrome c-type biogenesis protein CcmH/NrfG
MYVAQGNLTSAVGPLSEAVRLRPDHPHAGEQLQRVLTSIAGKK